MKRAGGRVHHSDRGARYTSDDFLAELKENDITPSMSGSGCCYDNAVVERFFGVMKRERVNRVSYRTREEAQSGVLEYIEMFYNRKRRHGYGGNISPATFEKWSGGLDETVQKGQRGDNDQQYFHRPTRSLSSSRAPPHISLDRIEKAIHIQYGFSCGISGFSLDITGDFSLRHGFYQRVLEVT